MEGTTIVADLTELITALTTGLTVTDMIGQLASVVGVGMGFVMMWFGVRKLVKAFSSAVFRGRIRI